MGYCPQFDALFETLTGREHLRLYAAIKVRFDGGKNPPLQSAERGAAYVTGTVSTVCSPVFEPIPLSTICHADVGIFCPCDTLVWWRELFSVARHIVLSVVPKNADYRYGLYG